MNLEEVIPILKQISIFGGMTEEGLSKIVALITVKDYAKEEVIFKEGEPSVAIYIVYSGKVKIVLHLEDNPYTLVEFTVGDCFGETAMIGIQNHATSAVAMEDSRIMLLTAQNFNDLYKGDPKLFSLLILNVARESCRRLCKNTKIIGDVIEALKR